MTRIPWAKISRQADGEVDGSLSLVDHSADVAACLEAILDLPIVAARLAKLTCRDSMPSIWRSRLCAHVALHDFGKANTGFQERWRSDAPFVGHCGEAYTAMQNKFIRPRLLAALPMAEMAAWGAFPQAQLVMLAHHGRPLDPCNADISTAVFWKIKGGYDPASALIPLGSALRAWYPSAFEPGGESLPEQPTFWHALLGFVILADWLGSDRRYFDFLANGSVDRMSWARQRAREALAQIEFDPTHWRTADLIGAAASFAAISQYPPRPMQLATGDAPGHLVILESETGSGKTEAALWRFARLFAAGEVDGLYFALPTRVAATSLHDRVEAAVERLFPDPKNRPTVTLAVPGLAQGPPGALGAAPDITENAADARRAPHWAAERPKRFLAGTVAVGTIDQALLGAISVKHAHLRLASLMRHLLVVDEVHASDAYMGRLLQHLLEVHQDAGGHALLLSATLGASARAKLLGGPHAEPPSLAEATAAPYPALSFDAALPPAGQPQNRRERTVEMALAEEMDDPDAIAARAIAAARDGAKVLVIRNLRRDAVAVFEALTARGATDLLLSVAGVATLHHGRFAREDRRLLDRAVEATLGGDRMAGGRVVVGTQTLEQSLDIDADYLLTDLCPADVLLQRLGRLHRRDGRKDRPAGFRAPRACIFAPKAMRPLLARGAHGLGFFGSGGEKIAFPYADLLAAEATRRAVLDFPRWRIPEMNRQLVECVTHPEAREDLLRILPDADAWRQADDDYAGRIWAQNSAATRALMPFHLPFTDPGVVMPTDNDFSSRLGARDLVVTFEPPVQGPFCQAVEQITLPDFWARGIDLDGNLKPHCETEGAAVVFTVQKSRFLYDNKGLRRHAGSPSGTAQLASSP